LSGSLGILQHSRGSGAAAIYQYSRAGQLRDCGRKSRNEQEIENAFAALAWEHVQAVMVASDAFFFLQRQRLAELALTNRLPSMFGQREYAEAGGLLSYGESLQEFFRRAAPFVDRIFKGAKPGDLPIEQPTKFHLVINRKTADALGLTIPPLLYIFADEVIE
jgi:putative ABC transport system substrate-binding protein